jgi:hypothetical protein
MLFLVAAQPQDFSGTNPCHRPLPDAISKRDSIMRSALLWLIGVPIPVIIILWLVIGHA